uniref:Gelsolin-like domain-containing protein n=1 Tax=Panagrolaimus sp. JU765 TaxID=591449 RepID=A0AC34R3T8_9BILA
MRKYLKFKGYPLHTPICKVGEGYEPALFRALLSFPSSNSKAPPVSVNQLAVVDKNEQFNVELMHETKTKKSTTNFNDDGKGTKKIWKIVSFNLVEIPIEEYGIFYSGDSYIISYVSPQIKNGIIYYWLGNHSTIDEKGAAAAYVSKIDENDFKGKSVQIRIIQSKEPEHFLKLFNDSIVILKGGVDSGFKSTSKAKKLDYVQNQK